MSSAQPVSRKASLALLAAPLLWLVPAAVHPSGEPYAGIAGETDMWLFTHISQLVLTPFLGALVWVLLGGLESVAARVARAALVVWLVFFSAFDAIAGVATGILSRYANSLAGEEREGVASAVDYLFQDSTLIGGGLSVLSSLGHMSWVVVAIAGSLAFRRAGAPRAAVVAMALSGIFASHSGVGAGIGLIALVVAGYSTLRWQAAGMTPARPARTSLEQSGATA